MSKQIDARRRLGVSTLDRRSLLLSAGGLGLVAALRPSLVRAGQPLNLNRVLFPLNARAVLNAPIPSNSQSIADLINDLRNGALLRVLPGTRAGPRSRLYSLDSFPSAGVGNLALPPLVPVLGSGSLTPVNDSGTPVSAAAATGISLADGAYLQTVDQISTAIDLSGGWSLSFSYRTPSGVNNSSRYWASVGKRSGLPFGITIADTSGGALIALVQDSRYDTVYVRSAAIPRASRHNARIEWDAASGQARWYVNDVASGPSVSLKWLPDIAGTNIQVGASLVPSSRSGAVGSIYDFSFQTTAADNISDWLYVGPAESIDAALVANLIIDSTDIFQPIDDAGAVEIDFGSGPIVMPIGFGGYVDPIETTTSYVSAEMPYCPVSLGSSRPDLSAIILTPPRFGKMAAGLSTTLLQAGDTSVVSSDGPPTPSYMTYLPGAGGKAIGQNSAGGLTRGGTDLLRTQQRDDVRVTNIVEMNRAPRLNGGGESWGHQNDTWVAIYALSYSYDPGSLLFPTVPGDAMTITIRQVPRAGEGTVRVGRTGRDLKAGDSLVLTDLKRLGWYKPNVSSVGTDCKLVLTVSVVGSPESIEVYRLRMTDAPRPAEFGYWAQADAVYSDRATRIRWASRGGDWTGEDGQWGSIPFAASTRVTGGSQFTIDVTTMVAKRGTSFFLNVLGGAGISIFPGLSSLPEKEPILRATWDDRQGSYRATRCATLYDSDGSTWKPVNSSPFIVKANQGMLLAFDGADTRNANRMELILQASSVSGGGGAVQVFSPTPKPPRPGPRVNAAAANIQSRSDLIAKVETDAEWSAMINNADGRNASGFGQPSNYTIANGCYYGGIPKGRNAGISLLRGFFKGDGTGYPVVRLGRMMGWHINYQPGDPTVGSLIVSGKSPGLLSTGSGSLSNLTAGFGGRSVSGYGGYTTRMQRGSPTGRAHLSGSPLQQFMAFGDYNYFISGNEHGVTTYGICPIPRMAWVWIETVHAVNTIHSDGTWENDGVFEMYVNGRKYCESRRLEWRVAGNPWLWDTIWFDEYNGGTEDARVDRLWPFVVGPTYAVYGDAPIAPPTNWNVPFVNAFGKPDDVGLAYKPDF